MADGRRRPGIVYIAFLIVVAMAVWNFFGGSGGSGKKTLNEDTFVIISGSENKSLEDIVSKYARKNKVDLAVIYMGSVDIARVLGQGENPTIEYEGHQVRVDAVWPASSLWINYGDENRIVRHIESIMTSPVVFAVRKSKAEELGWIDDDVFMTDILNAAREKKLSFAMTSATQSNSGASAYLAMLTAFSGISGPITSETLADGAVVEQVKEMLNAIDWSSGSSGWLRDRFLETYPRYDAMFNYESMIIEANAGFEEHGEKIRGLVSRNEEPLYAVYPVDGLAIADSPLGYIDQGDEKREEFFLGFQEYLKGEEAQEEILARGRRTGSIGMNPDAADAKIFNPDWGIDPGRIISPIPIPRGSVITEALNQYQTTWRKPSLTAYVIDYSGSMAGSGEEQVEEAMHLLLDQETAGRYLLQATPEDVSIVVAFNDGIKEVYGPVTGNDSKVLKKFEMNVLSMSPDGGTDIYQATAAAFELLEQIPNREDYFSSVILMSDGASDGSLRDLNQYLHRQPDGPTAPVFTILFGDAEPEQMEGMADAFGGRMFDGRSDVVKAFRSAKGYN